MNKKIAEKFFNNRSTPEETQRVLDWFCTPEGRKYLEENLDADFNLMDEESIRSLITDLDSERMYESIESRIRTIRTRSIVTDKKLDVLAPMLKIAASILVILTASLFVYSMYDPTPVTIVESDPIHFQTSNDQQRQITLGDGSVIRLNSNSEILVSEDLMRESREVSLTGEAYFEIEHNPDKPFIIHVNQSRIQVLGTAFNVKSNSGQDNVQVAVVEGRVSFASTTSSLKEHSVVIKQGQFGYLDVNDRTITIDDYAVENYLAWKSGRLEFDNLTLLQVCVQLNRLYDLQCSYTDESLKNLRLTSNFSNDSLDKTLSVISLSLDIRYNLDDSEVVWIDERVDHDERSESLD